MMDGLKTPATLLRAKCQVCPAPLFPRLLRFLAVGILGFERVN